MASGPIPGDEYSREKQRLEDINSNKVYARKNHKKPKNSTGVAQRRSSQKTLATTTDDNNSSQQQLRLVSRLDAVASDDSSSQSSGQPGAPNGANGGSRIPGYTKVDTRVKISMNSISKLEARVLKRKLVSELDQVRSLGKRLETKEGRFGGYSNNHTQSQFSANEMVVDKTVSGVRVNSEVGSVGPANSRPFRGSSVSVAVENSHNHGRGDRCGVEFAEKEKRTTKTNQHFRNSDFVLGKEKLTPVASNRKLKSGNGGKRDGGGGEMGGGRFGLDKGSTQLFKSCNNLLAKLMKHKFAWVFNTPVDVKGLGLIDYHTIIKNPMDLGTVKTRLNNNWYKLPKEFAEDVRLTFSNAILYNPKGQDVHYMAEQLLKIFEEQWAAIEAEYNLNRRFEVSHDVGLPTPTSRRAPAPVAPLPPPSTHAPRSAPAVVENRILERAESMTMPVDPNSKTVSSGQVARTPVPKKPKARDPDMRDMTFEEKQRLSINLQNLPSEKLDSIVQIIRKRNPELFLHDDEIELEIDSVDPQTLWELDKFVTNYKKSLSKNKRKAELAIQPSAEAGNNILETNLAPAVVETPKAAEAVEKIDVASSPVQVEKQIQVDDGSGSSSSSDSSSSSSDSGSSSDSDSDSSAGHRSEAANSPMSI